MSYYAISVDVSQLVDLDVLISPDEFITYTLLGDFKLPNTIVLAEQLAEFSYFTFGEFTAKTYNRAIAFVELKNKTPEQFGFKNYFKLPRKVSIIKTDPRIDTILLEFSDISTL